MVKSDRDIQMMNQQIIHFKEDNFSFKQNISIQKEQNYQNDKYKTEYITPIKKDSLLDLNLTEMTDKQICKTPSLETINYYGLSYDQRYNINDPIERIKKIYNFWYSQIEIIRKTNTTYTDKLNNSTLYFYENHKTVLNDTEIIYTGLMDDNLRKQGFGVIQWKDNSKYEGEWVDDRANGVGRLKHEEGDEYNGEWVDDQAHGYGTYYNAAEQSHFEGWWAADRQHGAGVEVFSDGSKYAGEYREGRKHGRGHFRWADGSLYHGDFRDNHIEGRGKYSWQDGRVFEGQWRRNQIHGQGVFTWPDGRVYEGHYVADQKEGFGKFFWRDGRKYIGDWAGGKQHGAGVLYQDGRALRGTWVQGRLLTEHDPAMTSGNDRSDHSDKSAKKQRLGEIFGKYDKKMRGYITLREYIQLCYTERLIKNEDELNGLLIKYNIREYVDLKEFCEMFE
eukprot:Mrub_02329.p1 GENE.Mrub_02329~~Mrub_02329.p1  ORF type:complete len:448 (+),score=148.83 Mrub_02329:381-1724(+)